MKRRRKVSQLLIRVVGAAALLGGMVVWWRWPTTESLAVTRYSAAACVAPNTRGDRKAWDRVVPLSGGKSFRVMATGQMNTMFELAFSDEDQRRQVTTWWDYSYPRDARLESSTATLWLVISGGLSDWWQRARLYEYDLNTRTIVRELDLEPDDLPEPCAAVLTPTVVAGASTAP